MTSLQKGTVEQLTSRVRKEKVRSSLLKYPLSELPAFTNKSVIQTIYDIITKGHRGTIDMELKSGEGAKFVVKLPVV